MTDTGAVVRTEAWRREAVSSPQTSRPAQMAKIFGYLKGLHATYLLDLGVRLGLFERLGETPQGLHAGALAAACGLDAGYTHCWCETACALELLDYDPASPACSARRCCRPFPTSRPGWRPGRRSWTSVVRDDLGQPAQHP